MAGVGEKRPYMAALVGVYAPPSLYPGLSRSGRLPAAPFAVACWLPRFPKRSNAAAR